MRALFLRSQICNLIFNLSVADHEFYFGMQLGAFCGQVAEYGLSGATAAELDAAQAQVERSGALAVAEASLRTEQGLGPLPAVAARR
jgi:hypothetical protein